MIPQKLEQILLQVFQIGFFKWIQTHIYYYTILIVSVLHANQLSFGKKTLNRPVIPVIDNQKNNIYILFGNKTQVYDIFRGIIGNKLIASRLTRLIKIVNTAVFLSEKAIIQRVKMLMVKKTGQAAYTQRNRQYPVLLAKEVVDMATCENKLKKRK